MTIDAAGSPPSTTAALLYAENAQGASLPESDLQVALDELAAAYPAYEMAEEYFEGTYGEYFASIRARRAMARTRSSFRLNFARGPVRAVADRLEIASITADDAEANKVLAALWDANELDLEAPSIHEKACEFGDCYGIVWPSPAPDDEDEDYADEALGDEVGDVDPADTDDGDGFTDVDIFYNSPLSVRIFYDPENPRKKAFAIKRWLLSNTKQVRVDLYYRDRIERTISKSGVTNPDATQLEPYTGDGQDAVLDNPFGEIPVFHWRNARPYGRPAHIDFYGAQQAIHKLIISHMSGVDYQSLPQRYAIGDPDADSSEAADTSEDAFAFPDELGGTREVDDPQSQLSGEPGSLWWLQRIKAVGQFAEADPEVFLKPTGFYLRGGAQLSETPMRLMDPNGNPPSGESVRMEDAPFTKKVESYQRFLGSTWRAMSCFALKIAGRDPARPELPGRFEKVKVKVQWKSAAIVDDLAGWQMVVAKINAGMPVKQAFLEAGYIQDQVDDWFGADGPGDDIPQKVDQLMKIAGALQAFSAAAATGLFSEEEIRTVIIAFLGEVGIDTTGETNGSPAWEPPAVPAAPPPFLADEAALGTPAPA